ncbi:hypothetical protein BC830DRAFT_1227149 [Chytriomyces sp. MP71]|nr:hypothetical protein BC830DRAFT_1227149 [Chytriomyces sp. MP71]
MQAAPLKQALSTLANASTKQAIARSSSVAAYGPASVADPLHRFHPFNHPHSNANLFAARKQLSSVATGSSVAMKAASSTAIGTGSSSNSSSQSENSGGSGGAGSQGGYRYPEARIAGALAAVVASAYALDHWVNTAPSRRHTEPDTLHNAPWLREYVASTFAHVGGALALTSASAVLFSKTLSKYHTARTRFRGFHPIVFLAAASAVVTSTAATYFTPPSQHEAKLALFAVAAVSKGLFISATVALNPALLSRVALYAGATVAMAALSVASPALLPVGAMMLPWYQVGLMYGALTMFGGAVLLDIRKVFANAQKVHDGKKRRDIINEALKLYLDIINVIP